MRTFCYIEYFIRTWIVQEVLFATKAHTAIYGDIYILWVDLKQIILTCFKLIRESLSQSPVVTSVQPSIYHPHTADSNGISALITMFARKKCSDPRDHVFALHSLWDSGAFPIRVDYNLSRCTLLVKLTSRLPTSALPMSSIITLIDALELVPERFAHGGEISAAEESIPITLSVAWSREIDMRELSKYRAMRLAAGKYKFSERTIARDF